MCKNYNEKIIKLNLENFRMCNNIWDMNKNAELAQRFYDEMLSGNRITYIYTINNEFIGQISLKYDCNDTDYTIKNQRIYISFLVVKPEHRQKGIGEKLVNFACKLASDIGYKEISIGVDIDNYPAIKLYHKCGFDKIIYVGEDEQGKYFKLLKEL